MQELCQILVDRYDGDAAQLWADVTDGRNCCAGCRRCPASAPRRHRSSSPCSASGSASGPDGWREAAGGYGEAGTYRSVADITDAESLRRVRAYKQQVKAAAKADGG